jgi:hypothetical protein
MLEDAVGHGDKILQEPGQLGNQVVAAERQLKLGGIVLENALRV